MNILKTMPAFALLLSLTCCATAQKINSLKTTPSLSVADSYYNAGNWKDALKIYEQVMKKDESKLSASSWNRAGFASHNTAVYKKAIQYFQKAITLQPPSQLMPFILSRMARTYSMMNDKTSALLNLEKAVAAGYINLPELQNGTDYKNIRSEKQFQVIFSELNQKVNPCAANQKNKEFDFWVGKWNVFQTGANFMVGTNTIEKSAGDCALLETWVSATGGETGKSLTYINKKTGKWEQTYIGSGGGVTIYTDGELKDNVMVFLYSMTKKNGTTVTGKFGFKLLPNGDVQQYQEETADNGKTWNKIFDFTYRKA